MTLTCPKCGAVLTHVSATAIDAYLPGRLLSSVAFSCPLCGVVLGVTADPIAIKTDTVTEILAALRK